MQYIIEEHPLHYIVYIPSALEFGLAKRKSKKSSCLHDLWPMENYNCGGKTRQNGTLGALKREHPTVSMGSEGTNEEIKFVH